MTTGKYDRSAKTDEQAIAGRLLLALRYSGAMMPEELSALGSLSRIAFADIWAALAMLEESGLVLRSGGRYRFFEISAEGKQEAGRLSEPGAAYVSCLPEREASPPVEEEEELPF